MEKPLISVIVPVYNVSQYLRKCLDSILRQTYKNIEIILVDDGSTDDSGEICDKYAENDARIRVVHKENGGLSSARNAGIDIMQGDFVTFVDSDDWINCRMIDRMYGILLEYNADISCVSFHKVFENDEKKYAASANGKVIVYTGTEAVERIMYKRSIATSAWGKLYNRQDFNNIRYPAGMIFEDLATTYKIFYGKKRIAYCNERLYYYFQRKDSIMSRKFSRKRFDRLVIGQEMMEWAKKNEPSLQKAAVSRYFTANMQLLREMPLTDEWRNNLNEIIENVKRYRSAVIKNRKAKKIDRLIALSTYLGVRPLKILGKLYKAVWP